MGLPGHRRTSSHKRRRAAHFALVAPAVVVDEKTGQSHLMHRAGQNATEYNGHEIHRKGTKRKLEKALAKTKAHAHDHTHEEKAA